MGVNILQNGKNTEQIVQFLQEKLLEFGLTRNESKVFLFLSKYESQKAKDISKKEGIPRTETYHLLSSLETKGIITSSIQRPAKFSAVKIEDAIESIIQNHLERIEELKMLKQEMFQLWNAFQNIIKEKSKK